ncbi:MAG: hypothetical protein V5A88_07150 [Candidatus Thermoplasmatota archaeon]
MKKKMKCVALMRCDTKKRNLGHKVSSALFRIPLEVDVYPDITDWHHKEDDTVDKISAEKLDETVDVVETFIRSLSQKIERDEW